MTSDSLNLDEEGKALLSVENLVKHFEIKEGLRIRGRKARRFVRAVDGVSLAVEKKSTVAVVGESGSGKSTLARAIMMLDPPNSGRVYLNGRLISTTRGVPRDVSDNIQMVFQDPDSSLDPMMSVAGCIAEPLHRTIPDETVRSARVREAMETVGLPEDYSSSRPNRLSGGERQRVAVARAIAPRPKLVILDEPTSALDASIQAQILTLLLDLQEKYSLSYLLITHNIAVAYYLSDKILVMYAGRVVEHGPTDKVIGRPRHPYTITLMQAIPKPDPTSRTLLGVEVEGEVPSAIEPPPGCRFHPRCPYAQAVCSREDPPLREIAPDQFVACHFAEQTG